MEPLEPRFLLNGELTALAGSGAFGDMAMDAAEGFLAFGSKLDDIISTLDEDFAGLPGMLAERFEVDDDGNVIEEETRPPKIADVLAKAVPRDPESLEDSDTGSLQEHGQSFDTSDEYVNLAQRADYLYGEPASDIFGNYWEGPAGETVLPSLDLDRDGLASWSEAFDVLFVGNMLSVLDDFAASDQDASDIDAVPEALNERIGAIAAEPPLFGSPGDAEFEGSEEFNGILALGSGSSFTFEADDPGDTQAYTLGFSGSLDFAFAHTFRLDFGIVADQLRVEALEEHFVDGEDVEAGATDVQPEIALTAELDIPLAFGFDLPEVDSDPSDSEYDDFHDSFGLRAGTFVGDGDDPIEMVLSSDQDLEGLFVNAGFLGLQANEDSTFTLEIAQAIEITPASLPSTLGFGSVPLESEDGVLEAEVPVDDFDHAVEFELAFDLAGTGTDTEPVEVIVAAADGEDAEQALRDALDGAGLGDLLTVDTDVDDKLSIALAEPNRGELDPRLDDGDILFDVGADDEENLDSLTAAFLFSVGGALPQRNFVNSDDHDDIDALVAHLNDQLEGVSVSKETETVENEDGDDEEVYTGQIRISADEPGDSLHLVDEFSIDADGVVRLDELTTSSANELFTLPPANDEHFAFDLGLEVIEGLERTTGDWGDIEIAFGSDDADDPDFSLFDLTAVLDGDGNPVSGSLVADRAGHLRLDYGAEMDADHLGVLEAGLGQEVVDFNTVGANSVVGMLGQLRSWADRVADSAYLGDLDVPFADLVLGEVLGFDALVQESLLFDRIGEEAEEFDPEDPADLEAVSRLIAQARIDGNLETLVPFTNVQELTARLDHLELLDTTEFEDGSLSFSEDGEAVIWYDPADADGHDPDNPKLLVPLTLSRLDARLSSADSPVDFLQRAAEAEGGTTSLLGPLELTFSDSTIEFEVSESMNVTLGIQLGQGGNLDENPPLFGDDGLGVTLLDAAAITGGEPVQDIQGRLSADAGFRIRVDGGEWVDITIHKADTETNESAEDLATDISDALFDQAIGDIQASVLHGRIVLVAEADVEAFDLDVSRSDTAYREIGLASSRASTVAVVLATEGSPELSEDGEVTITLNGGEEIDLTVPQDETQGNRTLGDLVGDLNDQLEAADEDRVIFSRSGDELVLGAIADGIHFLEVSFGDAFAGLFVDPAATGDDGVGAGLLLQADGEIASQFGRIEADANAIEIDYGADTVILGITAAETQADDIRSIGDLVERLNQKLADAGGDHADRIEFVALGAKRLGIEAKDSEVSEIGVSGAEPLGFEDNIAIDAALRLSAARDVAHYFGPEGAADFTLSYTAESGDDPVEVEIALTSDETLEARSLYDLERVIQDKLDEAFAEEDGFDASPLDVGIDNGRLVFTAREGVEPESFEITDTNEQARDALGLVDIDGLGNLEANSDDLLIRTRAGDVFTVDLGDATTIDDAIAAINDADGNDGKVTVAIAADNASLVVTDHTTPAGDNVFEIDTLNGSRVAHQLGIFSASSSEELERQADLDDDTIRGDRIGAPKLIDRLSIEDDGRDLLEADLTLTLPDFAAEARLGFLGIALEADTPEITASFSLDLTEPEEGSGYTLRQLFDAVRSDDLTALGDFLEEPEIDIGAGDGDIEFDISPLAGSGDAFGDLVDDLGLSGDESIVVRLADFGELTDGEFDLPDIQIGHFVEGAFETFDTFEEAFEAILGDLGSFSALDFSTFGAALDSLRDIVEGFSDIDFLGEEIPILGVSILDLVGIADDFADGIEEILDDPVGTLQQLEGRLTEALGLPDGAIGMAIDELDGADNLILELDFSRAFSEPLNIELDLAELAAEAGVDLPDEVTDNFGLYGAAGLAVGGSLDAKLSFGIELAELLDGDGAPQVPSVELLYGGERTNLAGNLRATGDNLTFNAALGPLGASVRDGTALLEFDFDLLDPEADEQTLTLFDASGPNADFLDTLLDALAPGLEGTAEATLPVYFPTSSSYLGDILLGAGLGLGADEGLELSGNLDGDELLAFSEGFFDDLDFENFDIFSGLPLLVDGFDLFLANLQSTLQGQVMGVDIPFLGDALGDGATVIEDFRQDFVDPFREQVEEAPQRGVEIVQDLLFRTLWSTTVLTKLDESAPDTALEDLDDAGFDFFDFEAVELGDMGGFLDDDHGVDIDHYVNAELDSENNGLQWNFVLGGSWSPDVEFDFDLGFPALGLELEADPEIILDWSLGLGLGLNTSKGAYIDVGRVEYEIGDDEDGDGHGDVTAGSDTIDEFQAGARIGFAGGSELDGRLGFLGLEVESYGYEKTESGDIVRAFDDDGNKVGSAFIDGELYGTGAFADFAVDLVNSGAGDDRLAFFEIGQLDVAATLEAGARLDVQGTLEFNDELLPDDAVAPLLPSIQADFLFDWGNTPDGQEDPLIEAGSAAGFQLNIADALNEIAFHDVRLNVGSFLTDLLGPIVGQIQEITGPLEPIIDVITEPIPVISDLAGKPVTLVDLAATFGEFNPGFIYAIADIIKLANDIDGLGGEDAFISLGDFTVFGDGSSLDSEDLASDSFDLAGAAGGVLPDDLDLSDVVEGLDGILDDPDATDSQKQAARQTKSLTSGFGEGGGFDFPILNDPAQIFGLLMGRPAVLVTYDMPPFVMDFEYQQSFPVYGPIFAVITVGLGMQIDLAFGYDTQGFQTFADGDFDNPLDLIGGFFVSDRENADGSGADVPELILTGEVFAGAEVNLGVASAGVEGGIILTVDFDLYDPDRDGRVRLSELLNTMQFEARTGSPALAPISIFDISGDIAAQLRAYIKILTSKTTIDITPPIVLFEFEIPFDREPILGDVSGETLTLNVGDYAHLRQEGDTRDIGEEIRVEQIGDGEVKVWSESFGVPVGAAQTYSGVDRILVRGGDGDDTIDLSGVDDIAAEVYGGEGNDEVMLGGGRDLVHGGLGHDLIDASDGGGDNIIVGGGGDDEILGGNGDDLIFGGRVFLRALDEDGATEEDWTQWAELRFTAGGSRAADGNNRIHTGNGQNLVFGGGGHDVIVGGDDADTLYADGGTFEIEKSSPWSVTSARYVDLGEGGNDRVFGGDGDDELHGGPGDDVLKGGEGDDTLHGNAGFDVLFGDGSAFGIDDALADDADFEFDGDTLAAIQWDFDDSYSHGENTLHGGTEGDLLFGGFGDSEIDGGRGSDTLFGDGGRVEYTAEGIAVRIHSLIDESDSDPVSGTNTLRGGGDGGNIVFGGAGVDDILGGGGPDIVFGGAGDDTIDGAAGPDVLFGDTGLVAYRNFAGDDEHRLIGDESLDADDPFNDDEHEDFDFDDNRLSLDLIVTSPNDIDGVDTVVGGDGDDILLGGGGGDHLYGDWEVDPADLPATAPQGNDVVIGDWGRLEFKERRVTTIRSLFAGDGEGGDDTLYGNGGDDVLIGGSGGDTLHGVNGGELDGDTFEPAIVEVVTGFDDDGEPITEPATGDDIAVGDNALLTFSPAIGLHAEGAALVTFGGYLALLETTDVTNDTGGVDTLFGDLGNNTLVGGAEGDDIHGAAGDDIVLGDNGEVAFGTEEIDVEGQTRAFVYLQRVESVVTEDENEADAFVGGVDTILGFTGTEIALGGIAGDTIDGHQGDDILLGDNGLVQLIASRDAGRTVDTGVPGALSFLAGVVERIVTADTANASGGEDTILGGEHDDIILGGARGDDLYGDGDAALAEGVGDNLILGDNGELRFDTGDADWVYLQLVHTALGGIEIGGDLADKPADASDFVGGADLVYAGDGADIVLGGLAGDEIHGQGGADILAGDNGRLDFLSGASLSGDIEKLGGVLETLDTTDAADDEGGQDLVLAGDGDDIVLGGVLGDLLFGEADEDTLLGDQGRLEWSPQVGNASHRTLDLVTTTNQATLGGRDLIDGGAGDDVVFGGTDSDLLFGGTGHDLLFGDHGELRPQDNTYAAGHAENFFAIDTGADDGGAGDLMFGGTGDDIMLGQQGNDAMYGGAGDDDMIGGHNVARGIDRLGTPSQVVTSGLDWDRRSDADWPLDPEAAPPRFNDLMDGGSGSDVMLGDNGTVWRSDATASQRHYQLNGETLHLMPGVGEEPATASGYPDLDLGGQGADPGWSFGRTITLLDHDHTTQDAGGDDRTFGDDLMAGGAQGDMLFGGLGDDVAQGDGSLEILDPFGLGDLLALWELNVTSGWQADTLDDLATLIGDLEADAIDPLRDSGDAGPQAFALQVDDEALAASDNPLLDLRFNVIERATDGDDYLEGNGGSDLLYGGLGQDDILGGSSALFGLASAGQRPDTGDELYGGAGERIERNEFVPHDEDFGDDDLAWQDRHGRDADVILGDNANVFRLVDGAGDPLSFNFDTSRHLVPEHYADGGAFFQARQFAPGTDPADIGAAWYDPGWLLIQPRAFELLDYQAGEGDIHGDNSGDDLIHGESGDDLIHGMAGHDAIFGDSEDDRITGGTGNDWISGGTGEDGVIGDDGLILPSRNGQAEPLFGIEAIEELDKTISTPGNIQQALINQSHELKLAVRLFSFPGEGGETLEAEGNDIIFGGLGNDWLHGGAGNDAVSGAEALPGYYDGSLNWLLIAQQEFWGIDDAIQPWFADRAPINPGDILQYEGRNPGTGEFALYDEHDPWRRIMLGDDGEWRKAIPEGGTLDDLFDFLLNFATDEGVVDTRFGEGLASDGDDRLFGDLGHDWLAGGTGRDHMYGGRGDDMLNMDDDHASNADTDDPLGNNQPDAYQSYADIVYGGAGRDRLILNTGADRAIDWVGEFNSYVVPFSPFGAFHISRSLQPHLQEFLYDLSESDGADPWAPDHARHAEDQAADRRVDDLDEARNYEPYGELGLVLQQDADWQEQTGAPDDPQPGNFQGKREIMRRELFHGDGTPGGQGASAFAVESGDWTMDDGLYTATAEVGQEAISILHVPDQLPGYLEILVDARVDKDKGGVDSNAYVVFDYQGEHDFKFAGIDQSTNKLQIGQRTAHGWEVLSQSNLKLWHDTNYELGLVLNGNVATIVVDGQHELSHAFAEDALNDGYLALGANNSVTHFGNFQLQKLPPLTTHEEAWTFDGADHGLQPGGGDWQLQDERLTGTATAAAPAMLFGELPDGVGAYAALELEARLEAEAGFVYAYQGADNYKFALLDAEAGQLLLGYVADDGRHLSAGLDVDLVDGERYDLKLTLTGGQVQAALKPAGAEDTEGNWQVLGHVYYSQLNAGDWGLMVETDGSASFDHFLARTDDVRYLDDDDALVAGSLATGDVASPAIPTDDQLAALLDEAVTRLQQAYGEALAIDADGVRIELADLGGQRLAQAVQGRILLDAQAAGHGWFVDATPGDDDEFRPLDDGRLEAAGGEAEERIDLLSALMHELGHLAGLTHGDDGGLMAETLEPGIRLLAGASGGGEGFGRGQDKGEGGALGHGLLLFDLGSGELRGEAGAEETPPVAAPAEPGPRPDRDPANADEVPLAEGAEAAEGVSFATVGSSALAKPLSLIGKFGSGLR